MTVRAVGFDYGGVLFGKPGDQFTNTLIALLDVDRQTFLDVYHRHNKKPNLGEITWTELWRLVLIDLGVPNMLEDVLQLDEEFYVKATIIQPVLDLVDRIKSRGYKVGILSNNSPDLVDAIVQNGIREHFDVVNISAITGYVKPEPEAFTHFARNLGISLDELVFIDDSKRSLSTATERGYTPIHFESVEKLVVDLTKLGLLGD